MNDPRFEYGVEFGLETVTDGIGGMNNPKFEYGVEFGLETEEVVTVVVDIDAEAMLTKGIGFDGNVTDGIVEDPPPKVIESTKVDTEAAIVSAVDSGVSVTT